MKTTVRVLVSLTALAGLFLLTGCNTVSIDATQYIGVPAAPPSNPAQVQILRQDPTRPHIQLGEIRAEPASDSVSVQTIEAALRNAAAKMGAAAVVIKSDRTEVVGATVTGPWYGRSVQQVMGRVVVGVAIKYSGPAGS